MTNKSMIDRESVEKRAEAALGGDPRKGKGGSLKGGSAEGTSTQALADPQHLHAPQLKPVIDETKTGLQKQSRKRPE